MNDFLSVIKETPLFREIAEDELDGMLGCLGARRRSFQKGELILRAGEPVSAVGVILEGRVQIIREDFAGNRDIQAELGPRDLFAEAFACANVDAIPVSVLAVTGCEVLLIDYRRIVTTCSSVCAFHTLLIGNMMKVLAEKNIRLSRKIEYLSKRSTREKLLAYLSGRAMDEGGETFELPFNRQELADYLCVDRSAMSSALCKLRDEGVLTFHKNRFTLHASG